MKATLTLISVFLLLSFNLSCATNRARSPEPVQPYPEQTIPFQPSSAAYFIEAIGGDGWDEIYSMQQTGDGGFIAAGETTSFGESFFDYDAWLVKIGASGFRKWGERYGDEQSWDVFRSVLPSGDGGYLAAGSTHASGSGSNLDGWVVKVDDNGDVVWKNTYGGSGYDYFNALQRTADGGYIVAGATTSFGDVDGDGWLVKIDGDGNIIWQKTYGGWSRERFNSIQPTPDGGYILAGVSGSGLDPSFGYTANGWLVRITSNGEVEWQNVYGRDRIDTFQSAIPVPDGGFLATGSIAPLNNAQRFNAWVVRVITANLFGKRNIGGLKMI